MTYARYLGAMHGDLGPMRDHSATQIHTFFIGRYSAVVPPLGKPGQPPVKAAAYQVSLSLSLFLALSHYLSFSLSLSHSLSLILTLTLILTLPQSLFLRFFPPAPLSPSTSDTESRSE